MQELELILKVQGGGGYAREGHNIIAGFYGKVYKEGERESIELCASNGCSYGS